MDNMTDKILELASLLGKSNDNNLDRLGKILKYKHTIQKAKELIELTEKQKKNYYKLILSCEREMWALLDELPITHMKYQDLKPLYLEHKELWKNAGLHISFTAYPIHHAIKEWVFTETLIWEKKKGISNRAN